MLSLLGEPALRPFRNHVAVSLTARASTLTLSPPFPARPARGAAGRAARSAEPPVRFDQIFLARRLPGVDGYLLELQRLGERDPLRVRAREGRLDLGGDTLAQLLRGLEPDLLEERREQPAPEAPGLAEGTGELGRPRSRLP